MKKLITLVLLLGVIVTSNVEVHGERGPSIHDIVMAEGPPDIGPARNEVPATDGVYYQEDDIIVLSFTRSIGVATIIIKTATNKVCYKTTVNTAIDRASYLRPTLSPGAYSIEVTGRFYESSGDFFVEGNRLAFDIE